MPRRKLLKPKQQPKPKPTSPQPVQFDDRVRMLSVREVAAHLGLSERAVRRHMHRGLLPKPIAIGSRLRWRVAELEEWLASQRRVTRARP